MGSHSEIHASTINFRGATKKKKIIQTYTLSLFKLRDTFSLPNYGTLASPFQSMGRSHFPTKLRDTFFPFPEYGALLFPFQITGHFLPLSRAWGAHFPSKLRDTLFPFPEYEALISRDTLILPGCTDSGTP